MVFLFILAFASLLFPLLAAPANGDRDDPIVVPHSDPSKFTCQCNAPAVSSYYCPPRGSNLDRKTPLGLAHGVADPNGALRFAVRYGTAVRWQPSSMVTAWDLPNGSTNVSALPLACPQPNLDPSAYTEDCLSMVLYVPPNLNAQSGVPTLMWIHGGSFIVGSASGAGLDGSRLAIATNSIVAVVQYRLGALGFLAPNGQTNLAVKDLVTALNFLGQVIPSFGGSPSKITLGGQSSGASLIRSLLAAPSTSSLFRYGILQSDPMNFGFLRPNTQTTLQNYFNSQLLCTPTDTACLNSLGTQALITAQMNTFGAAVSLDPAAGRNMPIRPVLDGAFITSPLDLSGTFPAQSKPLLITSTANEAGFGIYNVFGQPVPPTSLQYICDATFGPDRTNVILANPLYSPVLAPDGTCDIRTQLQTIGTDYLWRCSSWSFARSWVQNGGTAYVAQYVLGASYPGNEVVPYCTQPGVVCHQDDIEIVFGTVPNPTSSQSTLITQMQQRYRAFLQNGNPNTYGIPTWPTATTTDVRPILLGGSGQAPTGACDPSFWGAQVEYDYQFFNH